MEIVSGCFLIYARAKFLWCELPKTGMEEYLPEEVVWRRSKFGFYAPEKSWLSAIRSIMIDCIKKNKILLKIIRDNINLEKLDNLILWRLFSISKWINIFSVTDIA